MANAITYFEMALTSKGTDTSDRNGLLGFVSPFAHARLVALYAGAGREDDAERHWRALQAACTREDCDLQVLLDQARAAMSSARLGA